MELGPRKDDTSRNTLQHSSAVVRLRDASQSGMGYRPLHFQRSTERQLQTHPVCVSAWGWVIRLRITKKDV
ncbi:hypothetical protein ALQ58_200431 [Pseudomonas syringae pv. apii]|nr:hypothetical protein ALQ58_200431 [Pseudomonas syringae pv. apii]